MIDRAGNLAVAKAWVNPRGAGEMSGLRPFHHLPFGVVQNLPFARAKAAQPKLADSHSNQPQCWVTDGRGHSPYLSVSSLNQFNANPTRGHGLSKSNGRIPLQETRQVCRPAHRVNAFTRTARACRSARGANGLNDARLRLQNPNPARQRSSALKHNPTCQPLQLGGFGNTLNLRPILPRMRALGIEQPRVPARLVTKQKQTFGIGVKPADRINILWKTKLD